MVQRHSITKVRVDVWDMRKLYNLGGFERRVRKGIWSGNIARSEPVDATSRMIGRRVPLGSHNQNVVFLDENGNEAAKVHRIITPLGNIGAWGVNDPKKLVIAGTVYIKSETMVPVLKNKEINRILGRRGLAGGWTYAYWLNGQIQKRWKQLKKSLGADVD